MRLHRLAVPVAVGAVLLGGTAAVQDTAFRGKIEGKLTDSSHSALAKAGVKDADVTFRGRDGKVTAPSAAAAAKAGAVVKDVTGVRTVHAFGPHGEVALGSARTSRAGSGSDEAGAAGSATGSPSASSSASGAAGGASAEASATPPASAAPSGAPAASGAPTQAEREAVPAKIAKLGKITFGLDSDTLTASGLKVVQGAAAVLKEYPEVHVRVEGHTDSAGSAAHGMVLSERRANRVVAELVKLGISPSRLTAKGYGETRPIPGAPDAENRRVAFVVTN